MKHGHADLTLTFTFRYDDQGTRRDLLSIEAGGQVLPDGAAKAIWNQLSDLRCADLVTDAAWQDVHTTYGPGAKRVAS